MKACTGADCLAVKPLSEFYAKKGTRDGLTSQCKTCILNKMKEYRAANPEFVEKQKKASGEWQKRNSKYITAQRKGLTLRQYDELLAAQRYRCAGCNNPLGDDTRQIHIDHDHECCSGQRTCGKCVRGILCRGCNLALGHLRSDKTRVAMLWVYLLKFDRATEDVMA